MTVTILNKVRHQIDIALDTLNGTGDLSPAKAAKLRAIKPVVTFFATYLNDDNLFNLDDQSLTIGEVNDLRDRYSGLDTIVDELSRLMSKEPENTDVDGVLATGKFLKESLSDYLTSVIGIFKRLDDPLETTRVKGLRTLLNSGSDLSGGENIEEHVESARSASVELQQILDNFRKQYDIVVKQRRDAVEAIGDIETHAKKIEEILSSTRKESIEVDKNLRVAQNIAENVRRKYEDMNQAMDSFSQDLGRLRLDVEEVIAKGTDIYDSLQALVDPAIAHDLSATFSKRKTWLFRSTLVFMAFAVFLAVALAWQTIELLAAPTDLSLERTISISLRILPFIVLLFFFLRQFTKNRNLEEEYAFRESIASSMMSYVNKIEGDTKLKEELIRDTILNLYASPLTKIVEAAKGTTESKQSEALIQSIADLLKQTTSVVKKGIEKGGER